jgi:hypothetical protein|nr:MAG TPA: Sporulation protein Cse60 [Caudoviricetes sp.]
MKNVKEKQMEVKILQGVTPFEIELRVNEFLEKTPYRVVDIKFSSCAIKSMGVAETMYTAMIVYNTEG